MIFKKKSKLGRVGQINFFLFLDLKLSKIISAFKRLRRGGTRYGLAPHKPVLLVSLIEIIDRNLLSCNQFEVTPELVGIFKENWQLLVPTLHQPDFTQPFFYLQSDRIDGDAFWFLKPNPGCQINAHIKSVAKLREVCAYGFFDSTLFHFLADNNNRTFLTETILEHYFPAQKSLFYRSKQLGTGYLQDQVLDVLNDPEVKLRKKFVEDEEDVFVRNGLFKKMVPKLYTYRCAFTGMQLTSTFGHSFVDACHIIPFSISHNDKVTNGISLCPNLHRAFDRGLISISPDYRILVSQHILEDVKHDYSIQKLQGKPILLPQKKHQYPAPEYIAWHRENLFKI